MLATPQIEEWEDVINYTLIVNNSQTLLVPKKIVRKNYIYSVGEYLNKKIIEHRQNYHVINNTSLSKSRIDKKTGKYIIDPPSKKTIREKEIADIPYKQFVTDYTLEYPNLITEFRDDIKRRMTIGEYTLTDEDFDNMLYI